MNGLKSAGLEETEVMIIALAVATQRNSWELIFFIHNHILTN